MRLPGKALPFVFLAFFLTACSTGQPESGIGDWVWLDVNANGIQDEQEVGAPNVDVRLYDASAGVVEETKTNRDGYYNFEGVPAGSYFIEFEAPPQHSFTLQDVGQDETADSDASQADGRTEEFSHSEGGSDLSLDAGLIPPDVPPPHTATPTATPTPTPTVTPDPVEAYRQNEILIGSQVIKVKKISSEGSIDAQGRFTGSSLPEDDPLRELILFFILDPFGDLYLGLFGDLADLAINFSGYLPGDSRFQPSAALNVVPDASAATSFETENVVSEGNPNLTTDTLLLLARMGFTIEDLFGAREFSIWIYRAMRNDAGEVIGHDLIHVSLSEAEIEEIFELLTDEEAREDLEEGGDRRFVFGKVYSSLEGEIVDVSTQEVLDALDERLSLDSDSPYILELQSMFDRYLEWAEED